MMDDVNGIASYYQIELQKEGELDRDYRNRVAGALRDKGLLIEAHELHSGKRWDAEGSDVMTGVIGALAQKLQGVDYGSSGYRQIGDDIAAGTIVQHKRETSPEMALIAILMSEAGRGR
jgi:hypothetical protein